MPTGKTWNERVSAKGLAQIRAYIRAVCQHGYVKQQGNTDFVDEIMQIFYNYYN